MNGASTLWIIWTILGISFNTLGKTRNSLVESSVGETRWIIRTASTTTAFTQARQPWQTSHVYLIIIKTRSCSRVTMQQYKTLLSKHAGIWLSLDSSGLAIFWCQASALQYGYDESFPLSAFRTMSLRVWLTVEIWYPQYYYRYYWCCCFFFFYCFSFSQFSLYCLHSAT